jgi:uncharacterized membrane protein YqgA involved in biofilm formation
MIGTIVNTCTIIIGTIVGAVMHRGIKDEYKEILYTVLGLVCLAIGLNATITHFGKSEYPVLFIISITLGSVIGNALDLDGRFARLLNKWSKNNTNTNLAGGLSTATLLYCIGPLAMLGPIVSALKGDHTFLYTNATLDLVTSTIFASTYGIWMILAAPILFCWQGIFYLVAKLSSTAISDALMAELMIVGGLMIVASGLSLLKLKDCKTINMLPSLLIPVIWFIIQAVLN